MFYDEPRFVLPLDPEDKVTISWHTQGPVGGPFLLPIDPSRKVNTMARRFMEKAVGHLEDYVSLDFKWTKDNKPTDIRVSISNDPLTPGQLAGHEVRGVMLPHGSYNHLILRESPFWSSTGKRTALHELGHALGLSHPGSGGADPNYTTGDTIMSYNVVDSGYWYRPADLQRLQEIWGYDHKDKDPITGGNRR